MRPPLEITCVLGTVLGAGFEPSSEESEQRGENMTGSDCAHLPRTLPGGPEWTAVKAGGSRQAVPRSGQWPLHELRQLTGALLASACDTSRLGSLPGTGPSGDQRWQNGGLGSIWWAR